MQNNLDTYRKKIRQLTHADESVCVERLLQESQLSLEQRELIVAKGRELVTRCRLNSEKAGMLDKFMQQYSLSSKEGVALMCLAESLLRVPDAETADHLIAEKVLSGNWTEYRGLSDSMFVNASTWGLMLTGRVVHLDDEITNDTESWLKRIVNRLGEPLVRGSIRQAMKVMGQQYVLGKTIEEAVARGRKENREGTRFSFDMLGEGARTMADAQRYHAAYLQAIRSIGEHITEADVVAQDGISVKLSALHPRYEFAQKDRVMREMLPRVLQLAEEAKGFGLGFTIDAEESERLDLSLDIFESLVRSSHLSGWNGLGFVLQAYSKRAPLVAEWLAELARDAQQKIMVRLVKGAYWDTEIKHAQEQGFPDYPVYTRKIHTDLSYQICAAKLLASQDIIYPQFATHNAQTAAMILVMAQGKTFEFQRLHGMGDLLHHELEKESANVPVRVYAPVGAHKDLLPYLVRRLLENGANSSFVNRFLDEKVPVDAIVSDVEKATSSIPDLRNDSIPLPRDIFSFAGESRPNTNGMDLADHEVVIELLKVVEKVGNQAIATGPIIDGVEAASNGQAITCPAERSRVVGTCRHADPDDVTRALSVADTAQADWDKLGGIARADILERAADIMEARISELTALICYEAGRTLADGISEVREAADFLRYYALQARSKFNGSEIKNAPLGECEYRLQGRGVIFCISPWNFPLAIFTGQVAAALASGNTVIAKPADTTPLVASEAVKILHKAGVPGAVLNFLPGSGKLLGNIINADSRVKGVAFTGSTEVAQHIHHQLIERGIEIPTMIAETGGQNCMLVDSSALPEQVVDDVIRSAFLSAGQRCSALRVLYLQEEVADVLIAMLVGAMRELKLGVPWKLSTDVGPVIDQQAKQTLLSHIADMRKQATLHYACQISEETDASGSFVPPHLFEIDNIKQLPNEVFGPVLHVIRFQKFNLEQVIADINRTGFGLTFGVHTRIQSFADYVVQHTRVGNNYVNRNMVGAVVGVNPFGGQGLSGTGPKAGGPHYLVRFARESVNYKESQMVNVAFSPSKSEVDVDSETNMDSEKVSTALETAVGSQPSWNQAGGSYRAKILESAADMIGAQNPEIAEVASVCRYFAGQAKAKCGMPITLPGPTGETNELSLNGRGVIYCAVAEGTPLIESFAQVIAALAAGNTVIATATHSTVVQLRKLRSILVDVGLPQDVLQVLPMIRDRKWLTANPYVAAVAWRGELEEALDIQLELADRKGPIASVIVDEIGPGYIDRFMLEKTKTVNVVATGGNAQLLNLAE
ncbi:MAG: bifunctional proline dehydrogenase/L-glutamate gamma-semialdehyde dehydrogenase PutA [bacterium]